MLSKKILLTIVIVSITVLFLFIISCNNSIEESFYNRKPKIFLYWENKKGSTKRPEYLDLCFDTIVKHCSNSFEIVLLNEKTIHDYLPNLREDLDRKLSIPQKTDYFRFKLLHKYGGIWLDTDTIIMQDLMPLFKNLEKYDYVGGGCHTNDCSKTGHPYPFNGVMMSRPNTKFMELCVNECDKLLDENDTLEDKYFLIGRELMWNKIEELRKNGWDYYHVDSKCQERDSNYIKLRNHRFISNEDIDTNCLGKMFFIPIYNTAPGFPEWFKKMSKKDILNNNFLISKIFNLSLTR